jgi:hypothetical protein
MNCKKIKRELDIKGTELSPEVLQHIKGCKSCLKIYQTEHRIEEIFLRNAEIQAPDDLKTAILNSVGKKQERKGIIPLLSTVFKFSAAMSIVVFGFWLGLQTANGTLQDDISEHEEYAINTSVSTQDSFSEIYLSVLEEAANEK